MKRCCLIAVLLAVPLSGLAQQIEAKPDSPYFKRFYPNKVTPPHGLQLHKDDRLAICGDSITEQRMYSRMMETYLTVCVPELNVDVRQYGWSGETAPGFLNRMNNDVLRFKPTIATTCYGMNDHRYHSYLGEIGDQYRGAITSIVENFQRAGTRMIVGSSGSVGRVPNWGWNVQLANDREDLNLSLCTLRNIGLDVAQAHHAGFADVFWPMLIAGETAKERYGMGYMLEGNDGVHPGWAGHTVMAYAFLKSFGLDGNVGTIDYDFDAHRASASRGHDVLSVADDTIEIRSEKYPFCSPEGALNDINSMRSGFSIIPFENDLNRLTLRVKHAPKEGLLVTWGPTTKVFSAGQLESGINLAAEFRTNPFSTAFRAVDNAVAAKQAFETDQIKSKFHGVRDASQMEGVVAATEAQRQKLVERVKSAFVPVTHVIKLSRVN